MEWTRLNIIAEGQTEETFVRDVLAPHLATCRVTAQCRRVETGRRGYRRYRGGLVSYDKARRDIERWLRQDQSAYVTTMFDLYALPTSFPGFDEGARISDPHARVRRLQDAFAIDLGSPRFLPYIQLHEFEALLFSDIQKMDEALGLVSGSRLRELQAIRNAFESPEEIDGGTDSAPSKRLLSLYPGYDKVLFGARISSHIGLEAIRQACPHFAEWLARMESLASP